VGAFPLAGPGLPNISHSPSACPEMLSQVRCLGGTWSRCLLGTPVHGVWAQTLLWGDCPPVPLGGIGVGVTYLTPLMGRGGGWFIDFPSLRLFQVTYCVVISS
jgi:hypothetical protein